MTMTEVRLKSLTYLEESSDVDNSYGNKNATKDAQDVNLNLKNSIHDNLFMKVPNDVDGLNYAQYITSNQIPESTPIGVYESSMTLVEKINLLYQMKVSIRKNIIKNLKNGDDSEFYDANRKEIKPFVAYWKMIKPLEKPTTITLTRSPSSSQISWVNAVKITATIKDGTGVAIKDALLKFDFDGGSQTQNSNEKGTCIFTVPAGQKVGSKTYTVKYDGKVGEYLASEAQMKITFIKDTPKLTAKTANKIYAGYKARYQLTNSLGTVMSNTKVQIKIGSGSWTNYTTNSSGIVSVTISKAATVYYRFVETTYYKGVEGSQKFTIKDNEEKSKCSGTLTQSPTSRKPPYQIWSDLYSDCTASNYQRCGRDTSSDGDAKTLGSSAGSYHQPAKLIKKDWDLGVPNNAVIKSVHVIWAEKQTNGPSVSTAKAAFINIKKVTLKTSGAIAYEKTINTNSGGPSNGGSWVTHNLSLGTSFNPKKKLTLTLAYGPNTSTNTGTIYLKGPKVIVEYIPPQ